MRFAVHASAASSFDRRARLAPRPPPRAAGYTLFEVAVVLSIVGILVGAAIPRVEDLRDRMIVRGAREIVIGHFSRARSLALARGGAEVILTEVPSRVILAAAGTRPDTVDLYEEHGASLEILGAADEAEFEFGQLGIGRMTSRSISIQRGKAEADVVIAAYGRARRR